jgi:hypothetical protein
LGSLCARYEALVTKLIVPVLLSTRQWQNDMNRRNAAGNVIETHEHNGQFKEW